MWKDQLTAYDGQTITYDAIGNPLTYRDGMTFTWQNGRQLASSTKGSTTTTYTYNADGGRKTRTVGNKTYDYYYVDGVLYAMTVNNYTLYFMYDDTGRPYSFIFNINTGYGLLSHTLYYKYNLQGDVVGIYNTAGTEMLWYTYDPWGKLLSADGPMSSALGGLNPFLYRGYVYDYETGLYYCNSRYYDPETGRFVSPDTPSTLTTARMRVTDKNLYAYCDNNPVVRVDPGGQFWESVFDVVTLGISIVDVCKNPTDALAWATLVGDAIDLIPFVTGVGEATRTFKIATKLDDVYDASKTSKRVFNISKQKSEVFSKFKTVKGRSYRTSGSGKNKRFYDWDFTHNDIEVYDKNGKHLGSMDPITGKMYKGAVKGRKLW